MFLAARGSKVNSVSDKSQPKEAYFSISSSSKSALHQDSPSKTSLYTFAWFRDRFEGIHPITPSSFSKSSETLDFPVTTDTSDILSLKSSPLPLPSKSSADAKSIYKSKFGKFPVKAKSSCSLQNPLNSKTTSNETNFASNSHQDVENNLASTALGMLEFAQADSYYIRKRCASTQSTPSLRFNSNLLENTPPHVIRIWRPEFTPLVFPATTPSALPFMKGKEVIRPLGLIKVYDREVAELLWILASPLLISKLKVEIENSNPQQKHVDETITEDYYNNGHLVSIKRPTAPKHNIIETLVRELPTTPSFLVATHIEWPSDINNTSYEVVLEHRNGKSIVRASSLWYLVRMLADGQNDSNYIVDFLRTYRYFAKPIDVTRLLIVHYLNSVMNIKRRAKDKIENKVTQKQSVKQDECDINVQLRVLHTFQKWIDLFYEDFLFHPEVTELLLLFLEEIVIHDEKGAKLTDYIYEKMGERDIIPIGWLLLPNNGNKDCPQSLYQRFIQTKDGSDFASKITWGMSTATLTPPIASSPLTSSYTKDPSNIRGPIENLTIADIDPKDLAQQLTLLEQRLFAAIHINEFFNHLWCDKTIKDKMAPNLSGFIRWFNKIAYGISGIIVTTSSASARVTVVKRLIQAAQICLKIHNYNGCFEIVAGLEQSSVQRLKRLWRALPNKYRQIYSHLTRVISRSDNHRTYRTCLQVTGAGVPVLPYLGFHLTDLVFAEDGNPSYVSVMPTGCLTYSTLGQPTSTQRSDEENTESNMNIATNHLPSGSSQVVKTPSKPVLLINFAKFRLISKILGDIVQYQQLSYEFHEIPRTQEFIKNGMTTYSEDELYLYSLQCEPKP